MGFDGRLTPVREDSSSSLQYRARLYAPSAFNKPAKDASDADIETAPVQSIRTGPSNDHVSLPAIRASKQQQSNRGPAFSNSSSPEPGQHYSPGTSPQPYSPGSQQQPQHEQFLQLPGRQHKTVPAHAFACTNPSTAAGIPCAGAALEQHVLASRLMHASTNSRASTSSRRVSSSSYSSSRPRTQQHRDEAAEEEAFNAQQQLQQLYGHSSSCSPQVEAAAAQRILALPFAICTAADGSLYEVATGHVQLMMLRRQLASLGIQLTEEEVEMLTAEANAGAGRSMTLRPMMRMTEGGGDHTAGSSLSGAAPSNYANANFRSSNAESEDRAAAGSRLRKSVMSEGGRSSQAGSSHRVSSGGLAAGRRVSAVGGVHRRSALGAVMEAHAADNNAVDPHEQLPLDDVVLSHLTQLDLFVENLRQQLTNQAASVKAAKAEAAAVAAAVAAGHSPYSARRSRHVTPRSQYIQQQQQQLAAAQAEVGEDVGGQASQQKSGGRNWQAARGLVMLNIQNWQKQRARSSHMQVTPMRAPTWEDVIMMGDVYIKRRAGQGAAVYEARCAELGLTPCTQVLQQLDSSSANMAHCNLGAGGAPALGAALAANNNISSLDLRDNNLDGKAVAHILKGIVTATAAHLTKNAKQRNISFAHQSVAAIGANRVADGLPSVRNIPSYADNNQHQSNATPALLAGLSASVPSPQQSAAGSPIKKTKSLAVRWGEDSSYGGPSSPGADAASISLGYRTMPASPTKASAAAAAATGVSLYAWDEDGQDWALQDQQQQQQQYRVSSLAGSAGAGAGRFSSAAGGAQLQHLQAMSSQSASGSNNSQAGSAFFLPSPASQFTDQGIVSSNSSSAGAAAGAEAAARDAHFALSSLAGGASTVSFAVGSGSGGRSGWAPQGSHMGSGARSAAGAAAAAAEAAAAAAARDLELEEDCCGPDAAGTGISHQRHQTSHSISHQLSGRAGCAGAAQQRGSGTGCCQGSPCEPVIYSLLSELDLSENPLGLAGGKAVAQLLDPTVHPSQFLVKLNLSKCNLGEAGGLAIAAALHSGNLELRVLLLSHINLGNKTAAAFGDLLESSHTLKELDLSWNQIKADGARALAKGLAANATLSKLSLAWNSIEDGASAMGDMLAANMGLKHLDLSHCRVGSEACMMLGEGLKGNVMLEVLLLSGNDRIGEDGARHLMVALAANRSLQFLGLNGSNMTSAVHEAGGGAAEFNPANPDGSYNLDLAVAADRVVAVQLVELDRAAEKELLRGITVDGKVIPSARKANWPSMLPSRGMLSCTFSSASVRKAMGVMESSKLTTLLKQLRIRSMSDRERLEMVAMFAPFALFTCKQISHVTQTFSIGAERIAAATLLFTRAADTATDMVSLTSSMSSYDLLGWKDVLGWYNTYRWNVPTGHYELDLSLPVHAAIAVRLRDESNDSPDGPTWMNLLYDCATTCMKKPQNHGPPEDWKAAIPTRGSVSLDYVSTHPPGSKQQHTTWGLPPLSTNSGTGTRSRATSATGARASTNGAVKVSSTGVARPSGTGSAAVGGQAGGRASGIGAAAAADEEAPRPVSDKDLEVLMKVKMGLQADTAAAAAASNANTGSLAGADAEAGVPDSSSSSGSSGGSSASVSAGGMSVAAADIGITALRQAIATGLLLVSAQVRRLVEAFTLSPHRVEVAVICWPITLDRDDNYWTVLYCLQGIEQSNLLQRLGPARLFNPAHASCHWVLDLSHPAHEEVAKKLVALASSSGNSKDKNDESALQNWWNLRLRGARKQVNENGNNMWGMLTAEDFQPILEFDFLGPDSWGLAGKTEAEVAALAAGDKQELRARQAARLEAVRMKQLYTYSCDGSSFPRQPWATYQSLMSPQLMKTPWAAAWDRLVRVLLRLDIRIGAVSKHSSMLQQAFEAAAASEQMRIVTMLPAAAPAAAPAGEVDGEQGPEGTAEAAVAAAAGDGSKQGSRRNSAQAAAAAAAGTAAAAAAVPMPSAAADAAAESDSSDDEEEDEQLCITAQEFEALLKSWGYNKTEQFHYLKLMEAVLQAEQDAKQAAAKAAGAQARGASATSPAAAAAAADAAGLPAQTSSSSDGSKPQLVKKDSARAAGTTASSSSGSTASAAAAGKGKQSGTQTKPKAGFAAAATMVKTGLKMQAAFGVGKGKAGGGRAPTGADAGAVHGSGDGTAASSFASQLEARFDRGLTFSEFVNIVMIEPPKATNPKMELHLQHC